MNFTKMNFRALMLSLSVMLFAGSMVSCSSDDNSKDDPTTLIPTTGVMKCSFEPSEDMLTLFDITVEYTDASGKQQTENITGTWNKTITYTTLPVNATMVVKQALKSNVEMTKDSYKFTYKSNCSCTSLYSDGSIADNGPTTPETTTFTVDKEKVAELAKDPILAEYSYTISNEKNSAGRYVW